MRRPTTKRFLMLLTMVLAGMMLTTQSAWAQNKFFKKALKTPRAYAKGYCAVRVNAGSYYIDDPQLIKRYTLEDLKKFCEKKGYVLVDHTTRYLCYRMAVGRQYAYPDNVYFVPKEEYSQYKQEVAERDKKIAEEKYEKEKKKALSKGSEFSKNGIKYRITSEGFVCIKGSENLSGVVTVPQQVIHYDTPLTVTAIDGNPFNNEKITSVTLPSTITSISGSVFTGSSITTVEIPSNVKLGNCYALFRNCKKLVSVKLPANIESIGDSWFEGCVSLKSVKLPAGIKKIESCAFKGSGITSISFPSSLTEIGVRAFEDCESLQSVYIPNSVTTLGTFAFAGCCGITSASMSETLANKIDDRTAPFAGCSMDTLKSVTIRCGDGKTIQDNNVKFFVRSLSQEQKEALRRAAGL